MTTIRRRPYRTPSPEHIIFGQWNILTNDDMQPIPTYMPHWDPGITFTALISLQINTGAIASTCGLGSDAQLRLAAIWDSPGTVISGCGDVIDLNINHIVEQHHLRITINGILVSQMVNLTAQLLLVDPGSQPQLFAPNLVGSMLAEKTQPLRLEGIGSRFPVEIIDFTSTPYAAGAAYALYWDEDDLRQTFLGSVRLYINSRNKTIVRAVSQQRPDNTGVWDVIRFDVARALIYGALHNDEFTSMPESYADGSVGATVRELLKRCFPGMSVEQCRDQSYHRLIFETQLQAALRVFGEA